MLNTAVRITEQWSGALAISTVFTKTIKSCSNLFSPTGAYNAQRTSDAMTAPFMVLLYSYSEKRN
jgi:hypothetical protein